MPYSADRTAPELRVTTFTDEYRSRLEGFFRDIWTPPSLARSPAWLDWHIRLNPYASASSPTLLLALVDRSVIGVLFLIPTLMYTDGIPNRVAWGRDLYVASHFRRNKVGLLLNQRWAELYDAALGSGQSEVMRSLQQKHGWADISRISQLEKLYCDSSLLRRAGHKEPIRLLRRSLAMAYGRVFTRTRPLDPTHTIVSKESFSDDLHVLWRQCRQEYRRICCRDLPTVRWRFCQHPYLRYTITELHDESGAYRGYVVSRRKGDDCSIIDLLTRRDDDVARRSLISAVESYWRQQGVSRFVCRSACQPLIRALRAGGYLPTRFGQFACAKTAPDSTLVFDQEFYITSMDSDLDR